MILAAFFRGPFDGERLLLPTEEPWPRFVIPKVDVITVEYFYLFAGHEDDLFFYLYEGEDFANVIIDDEPDTC